MKVRRATPKDADFIAHMVAETAREDGLAPPRLNAELVKSHAFGQRAAFDALLLEDSGKACGGAVFSRGYDVHGACSRLVVHALYVAPDLRGGGMARHLARALAERAREWAAREIFFATGLESEVGRTFLSSIGAQENKRSLFVLGRDQIEWLAAEGA